MKKLITVLWIVFAVSLVLFGVFVFTSHTQTTWQAFSVLMPLAFLSFWGAVILTLVSNFKKK
ncbi:MAG: hypothetical protein IJZ47_12145 [Oscillospiraceae bacterium]|nr:hypothetical protein [Oscillospiraceae bacterium]